MHSCSRGRGTPTPQRPVPAGTGRCGGLRGPRAQPTDESPHRDRRLTDYPKHTPPITYPWPQTDIHLGQRGQNLLRLKYPSIPGRKDTDPTMVRILDEHDGGDFADRGPRERQRNRPRGRCSSRGAAATPRSRLAPPSSPFSVKSSSWSLRGPHTSPGPFNRTTRRAIPLTRGWPRSLDANSADAPPRLRLRGQHHRRPGF